MMKYCNPVRVLAVFWSFCFVIMGGYAFQTFVQDHQRRPANHNLFKAQRRSTALLDVSVSPLPGGKKQANTHQHGVKAQLLSLFGVRIGAQLQTGSADCKKQSTTETLSHQVVAENDCFLINTGSSLSEVADLHIVDEQPNHEGVQEENDNKQEHYETPQIQELLAFIIPAVAMIQAPAIMSIVDTAVVGRASSLGLAALSPATQMCDAATYITGFLGMLTANRVAAAAARGDSQAFKKSVSESFAYAVGLGLLIIAVVQIFGKAYMTLVVGQGAPEIIPLAVQFARIRVLGAIAITVTAAGQAICFGLKDSVTPLKIIVMNAVLNLLATIFLVCKLGLGIQGAAAATALSEMVGAVVMVRTVKGKLQDPPPKLFALPSFEDTKQFFAEGLPLSFMLWAQEASFACLLSNVALGGAAALGAFQIRRTAPVWAGMAVGYALSLGLEGALVALGDGAHLARAFAALLLLKVGYLEILKRLFQRQMMVAGNFAVLSWAGWLLFNLGRCSTFSLRLRTKLQQQQCEQSSLLLLEDEIDCAKDVPALSC